MTPSRTKGSHDALLVIVADLQRVRNVKLVEFWVEWLVKSGRDTGHPHLMAPYHIVHPRKCPVYQRKLKKITARNPLYW